jgi:hypothetical protein
LAVMVLPESEEVDGHGHITDQQDQ